MGHNASKKGLNIHDVVNQLKASVSTVFPGATKRGLSSFDELCPTMYIFWLSSMIHSAQTRRKHISPFIHHFFFPETGSPLSIFTGFFKIIGGDGEGLEGGGGEGGDGS